MTVAHHKHVERKMTTNSSFTTRLCARSIGLGLIIVLVLAACAPAATPTPASANSIQGILWQWTSVMDQPTQQTTTVPNPANYTIIFNTDGTLTGKADCNSFSGTYSTQNGFTIKLGPTTLAACGEASLDQMYLHLLSNVTAGGPDGAGGLVLETAGGAQRLMFKNGGVAPK